MAYNYLDKVHNIQQVNRYTLAKTYGMFDWCGLPETIPTLELEKLLQFNGYAFITEVQGELYALQGGLGGVPDAYGRPTEIIVANPYLRLNKTYNIETDGVLIKNDPEQIGLYPLIDKHNSLQNEIDITLLMRGFTSRMQVLLSAGDSKTHASAEKYLEKIVAGELGVIGESALLEGVKAHFNAADSAAGITALIELQQFYKGSLHNELGLGTNYNMKRERLTDDEVQANESAIYPLIDSMLLCRDQAVRALNEKYNLDATICFGSIWAKRNHDHEEHNPDFAAQNPDFVEQNPTIDMQEVEPLQNLPHSLDEQPEQPLKQPLNISPEITESEPVEEPEEPLNEPVEEPLNEPVEEPLNEPVEEPEEPLNDPEEEPEEEKTNE